MTNFDSVAHIYYPEPEDEIYRYYSINHKFTQVRRRIHSSIMPSAKDPRTIKILKSKASLREEIRKQLFYYPYMIHPFSEFREYWELLMVFTLFMYYVFSPFVTVQRGYTALSFWFSIKAFFYIIFLLDILVTFQTGVYSTTITYVIFKRSFIIKKYMKFYLWVDLISIIPAELVGLKYSMYDGKNVQYFQCVHIICFIKILRIRTFFTYVDNSLELYNITNETVKKVVQTSIFTIILLLWAAMIHMIIFFHNDCSADLEHIINSNYTLSHIFTVFLYRSTSQLTLSGIGLARPAKSDELPFNLAVYIFLLILIGFICRSLLISYLLIYYDHKRSSRRKFNILAQQANEYAQSKKLPVYMKKRILQYYNFRYQKHFLKEDRLKSLLSQKLKEEVLLHDLKQFYLNVEYFTNFPYNLKVQIGNVIKEEYYLANDVVVQSNTEGFEMYFIVSGTVAIFSSTGTKLGYLEDGEYFGELGIILDSDFRIANVVAIEPCIILVLQRKDFMRIIHPYPQILIQIQRMAIENLEYINEKRISMSQISTTKTNRASYYYQAIAK